MLGEATATRGLAARLRHATAEQHRAAEARVDAPGRLGSLAGYVGLLQLLEGFHAQLEESVAPWVEVREVPGELRAGWRRAGLLRADLLALGAAPDAGDAPVDVPAGRDAALGAWYVLEGSRLGGRVIAREARRRLPAARGGLSAFEASVPAGRWATFRAWLDAAVEHEPDAVGGARAAFAALQARTALEQAGPGVRVGVRA